MAIQDWDDLTRSVRQGFGDSIVCLASLATLERGNEPTAIQAVNRIGAGTTARLIRDAVFFRMHILAARGFSASRHPDDIHLRAAVDFLRPFDHRIGQSDASRLERLKLAVSLFDELDNSELHKKVERMRHKEMAHVASYGEGIARPLITELFEFTRRTCAIWEAMAFGTGIASVALEGQIDLYRFSADRFWLQFERFDARGDGEFGPAVNDENSMLP